MGDPLVLKAAQTAKASWLQKLVKPRPLFRVYNLGSMGGFDVESSSMFPLILPKDKVVVIKAKRLNRDDIVVFTKNSRLIAHRLIYVSPRKDYLVTRGDNNLSSDGKISQSQILGKIETLKRGGGKLSLSHVYLTQSSIYLKELKEIDLAFREQGVPYVILKGLPVHITINNSPPKRLYLDADILVKKGDFKKATQALLDLQFKKLKSTLLGKEAELSSQLDFTKFTNPFPVTIDLHKSPAIGFTKTRILDYLAPDSNLFSDYLFRNVRNVYVGSTKFPILKNETLLIFLLLHLFHHNFRGIERIRLISDLIAIGHLNWKRVRKDTKKLNVDPYISCALIFVNKYYPGAPKLPRSVLYSALTLFISPFNSLPKHLERAERFILLILLSPESLWKKVSVVFEPKVYSYFFKTIKSFFLSSVRK